MYQKSCFRHTDEIKDYICDKKFPLHNITHEEIQKYMFMYLLNDFYSNILAGVFVHQTGTEMFIYIFIVFQKQFGS